MSGRARVLAVGKTDDLTTCLWAVHSVRGLEVAGVMQVDAGIPELVEAVRPDLALVCSDTDGSELLEVLRRLRERGRHQCDVLLVVRRPQPELVLGVARFGVFSCLVAPVEPLALRALLEAWLDRRQLAERKAPDDSLEQDEVDLLLHGPSSCRKRRPVVTPTLALVTMALRDSHGYLSASEVGRLCNLSAVASRRYLKQLVDQGAAVMKVQYGKTGRPRHLFSWTE